MIKPANTTPAKDWPQVVNLGETRLEKAGIDHLKVEAPCGPTLSRLADELLAPPAAAGGTTRGARGSGALMKMGDAGATGTGKCVCQ